jgi:NAD(P)-dependent dehydrogenase (short-subunit alcohol dehydrogenase family)
VSRGKRVDNRRFLARSKKILALNTGGASFIAEELHDMSESQDRILSIIGRTRDLFETDLIDHERQLAERVRGASFLVIGGAGSIGQAVVKQIFSRNPDRLHVVDISENNLVELVRDIRSSLGYIDGDFQTLPLDCGSDEFRAFLETQRPYDYILNLSALKHVRSEKDPYTLMRMFAVNISNTVSVLRYATESGCRKYFGVSTDKAVNPANAMGATKSVMEMTMMRASQDLAISTARFANVAFSDGSLLHGFTERVKKRQPIAAPRDVRRYFITPVESGELCLFSCLVGENRDIFFPKLDDRLELIHFPPIAIRYLATQGYTPCECATEEEARARVDELLPQKQWPCFFFDSDTTGEKDFEEFYATDDRLQMDRFDAIGIVKKPAFTGAAGLDTFLEALEGLRRRGYWTRTDLLDLLESILPDFRHQEMNRFLDGRM